MMRSQMTYEYAGGFQPGDRVRLISQDSKWNRHAVACLEIGTTGTVLEPTSEDDWPADAVQVAMGNGRGAIEAKCLAKETKP